MGKVEMDKIGKLIRALNDRAEFEEEHMGATVGAEIVIITRTDLRKLLKQLEVLCDESNKAATSG